MSEEEKKKETNEQQGDGISRIILLGITAVLMGWFMISACTFFAEHMVVLNNTYSIETTDTPIFSLHDGSQITGHFVLGTGSVGGEGYYAYYVSTGPARSKRMSVVSDYTELVEDEEDSPYIREFVAMRTTCTSSICEKSPSTYHMEGGEWYRGYKKWELHVPNGTLTRDMEVGHA